MKYEKPIDLSVKTLRMAVRKKDLRGVKRLAHGENLNKKVGITGSTILHFLASREDEENLAIARTIVESGADLSISDKNGNTPQDIARQKNNRQMEAILSNKNALTSTQTATPYTFFKFNDKNDKIENIVVEIDPRDILEKGKFTP